ncbi:MAG TPA: hypothetical protein VHH90_07120 [Polyangia bacterium]|nr:hypothetical protein [Polyangia bacterium]
MRAGRSVGLRLSRGVVAVAVLLGTGQPASSQTCMPLARLATEIG